MGNPLAAILQQLTQSGGSPPPAMATAPTPTSAVAGPTSTPSPSPMSGVLSEAMNRLNTTPFQPTPTSSPTVDSSIHPVLAKVIQTLASGAGAYGWTAMSPQEREARTQMEQQKAETMARLAQAGTQAEWTRQLGEERVGVERERARTAEENVQREKERDRTLADIATQRVQTQRDMVEVRKNATEGRLAVAHQQLEQRAAQFEQSFQLRAKQVGIEQAKLELGEQANAIKQGFLDVARGALSQRGTVEADQVNQKLQEFQREHWIASSVFGFPDISTLTQQSQGAGIPGVGTPATGAAPAATTAPGTALAPAKPGTPAKTPPKPKSGGTVIRYDSQGNRVQ